MAKSYAFSYKAGSSLIHRCPAWIKLLLLPLISILIFKLPPLFSIVLLILNFILASFLHFSLKEQLSDLKVIFYYAFFLIFARIFTVIFSGLGQDLVQSQAQALSQVQGLSQAQALSQAQGLSQAQALSQVQATSQAQAPSFTLHDFFLEKETCLSLVKLFSLMQLTALIFRTSTSLQIREGLENIELTLRRPFSSGKKPLKAPVAQTISLFINFIPQVSKIWNQAQLAWKARRGRTGIRMYLTLLPLLFSVGMKQAYNSARAITIRS
ncbi:MAG: hypothetical protein K5681_01900 [Treponema sp.]|nr:hypothetical protein [Treponema sp.]